LPDGIFSNEKKWVNFGGSCNGRCWYILWTIGKFYSHLVNFVAIWYIVSRFGMLHQEKSGNPGALTLVFAVTKETFFLPG
jgi:hypothetical protein